MKPSATIPRIKKQEPKQALRTRSAKKRGVSRFLHPPSITLIPRETEEPRRYRYMQSGAPTTNSVHANRSWLHGVSFQYSSRIEMCDGGAPHHGRISDGCVPTPYGETDVCPSAAKLTIEVGLLFRDSLLSESSRRSFRGMRMMCLEVGLHCGDFAFEVRTQNLRTVHQIRHSLMICVICDARMLSARSAERGYPSGFGVILRFPVYMMAVEASHATWY